MAKKRPKSKAAKVKERKPATPNDSLANESIATVLSKKINPPPVLMKVCRLCEARDGPFLNIFDAEKITAKKIDHLMPFKIEENDDLPHKICFRCSAKLEELYEFLQKCVKTQENLRTAMGKTGPLVLKSKTRALWEENLEKKNLSNEDICDILIKKAMEGIKDIPPRVLTPPKEETPSTPVLPSTAKKAKIPPKNAPTPVSSDDEQEEQNLKQVKMAAPKCEDKPPPRKTRSNKTEPVQDTIQSVSKKSLPVTKHTESVEHDVNKDDSSKNLITNFSMDYTEDNSPEPQKEQPQTVKTYGPNKKPLPISKPFNIMDHVCTIKVHGVGILFQCKLCNRNFLKKDVVESHGCAKNNVPKDISQNSTPLPEPPKPPNTVKYITIDKDFKKNLDKNKSERQNVEQIVPERTILPDPVQLVSVKPEPANPPPVKPKPKAGPASRMKQLEQKSELNPQIEPQRTEPNVAGNISQANQSNPVNAATPAVSFPSIPTLNGLYKLLPGPNNTFTLIDSSQQQTTVPEQNVLILNKKRLVDVVEKVPVRPQGQPYPVGLFQSVPHASGISPAQIMQAPFPTNQYTAPFVPHTISVPTVLPQPPTFTTPAMKKQSYTIVQTGHPSKLLISTKPQPHQQSSVPQEEPKKKSKKKSESKEDQSQDKSRQYFTFVNVESETQPSFVLPTNNIIQESQISTSTPVTKVVDDKSYTCNMCNEKFSREKKLLSHIQSHYAMMDEEDEKRSVPRKKSRKS